jgi:hypothetical protein
VFYEDTANSKTVPSCLSSPSSLPSSTSLKERSPSPPSSSSSSSSFSSSFPSSSSSSSSSVPSSSKEPSSSSSSSSSSSKEPSSSSSSSKEPSSSSSVPSSSSYHSIDDRGATIPLANDLPIGLSDGAPINFPFAMLSEWTDNFKDQIGKGSFGCVFSGIVVFSNEVDGQQGLRVAVKKMKDQNFVASSASTRTADHSEATSSLSAVQREIRFLREIRHPNILSVL